MENVDLNLKKSEISIIKITLQSENVIRFPGKSRQFFPLDVFGTKYYLCNPFSFEYFYSDTYNINWDFCIRKMVDFEFIFKNK